MSSAAPVATSPILSITRGDSAGLPKLPTHAHPEPVLFWTSTATLRGVVDSRVWLVPPGYGLWVPGGLEHGGDVVHDGEISIIHLVAKDCPITWTEPTGVAIGPLLRELIRHLGRIGPQDVSRSSAEALMFELLTPLATHDIQVSMPSDPRVRAVAERLLADPSDQRGLAFWADHLHTGVRTLTRLFPAETGQSFAAWRTQVRVRAAIQLLGGGTSVNATAHAVGYSRPSAFISAFRRVTGQTPGTYLHHDGVQAPGQVPTTGDVTGSG